MNRLNLLSLITLLCSLTALGATPRFTLEYQPETDLGNTQGFTIADFTVDEAESAPYHYSMKVSPSWRTRFRINRRNDSGGSDRNYGPVNDDEKLLRSDKEILQLTGGDYFLFLGEKGEVNISFDVDAFNTITNFKITGITPHTPKLFLSASDNNWDTEALHWAPVEGSDRKWTASYSRHMANGAIFGFKPMIYGWQYNKSAPEWYQENGYWYGGGAINPNFEPSDVEKNKGNFTYQGRSGEVSFTFIYEENLDGSAPYALEAFSFTGLEHLPNHFQLLLKEPGGETRTIDLNQVNEGDTNYYDITLERMQGELSFSVLNNDEHWGPATASRAWNTKVEPLYDEGHEFTLTADPAKRYRLEFWYSYNSAYGTRPHMQLTDSDIEVPQLMVHGQHSGSSPVWSDAVGALTGSVNPIGSEHLFHYEGTVDFPQLAQFGIRKAFQNGNTQYWWSVPAGVEPDITDTWQIAQLGSGVNSWVVKTAPGPLSISFDYDGVITNPDGSTSNNLYNLTIQGQPAQTLLADVRLQVDSEEIPMTYAVNIYGQTDYNTLSATFPGTGQPVTLSVTDLVQPRGALDPDNSILQEEILAPMADGTPGFTLPTHPLLHYTVTYLRSYRGEDGVNRPYLRISTEKTGCPVLPARVLADTPKEWSKVSAENPAVYLVAEILNDNRVTPEFEMLPSATRPGIYEKKNFLLHSHSLPGVKVYTSGTDNPTAQYGATLRTPTGNKRWTDGTIYLFDDGSLPEHDSYEGGASDPGKIVDAEYDSASGTLTIIPSEKFTITYTGEDEVEPRTYCIDPFISIVGDDIKQPQNLPTPNILWGRRACSDDAWQESWLQHDSRGNILLDRFGDPMYNTCFPPVNEVFFMAKRTAFDGTETLLELNEDSFTLVPQCSTDGRVMALRGHEWEALLKAQMGEELFQANYGNLFAPDQTQTPDLVNDGSLQTFPLDRDRIYVRYSVENFWFLGPIKLFGGFTGGTYKGGDGLNRANWGRANNWGFVDDAKKDDEGIEGYGLTPCYPYQALGNASNFKTEQPSYFRSLQLFYCVEDESHTLKQAPLLSSVLYTVPSEGNANVQARAYRNASGRFQVGFDTDLLPDCTHVESLTVRRYDALCENQWIGIGRDGSHSSDNLVYEDTSLSLTLQEFLERFQGFGPLCDDPMLASGKYFYGVDIVFRREGSQEPLHISNLKSNPFTITLLDVPSSLEVHQLVGNKDASLTPAQYVTYAPEAEEAFAVFTDEQGQPVSIEPLAEVPGKEYYGNATRCLWTTQVLLRTSLGDFDPALADHITLSGFQAEEETITPAKELMLIRDAGTAPREITLQLWHTLYPVTEPTDRQPLPAQAISVTHQNTLPSMTSAGITATMSKVPTAPEGHETFTMTHPLTGDMNIEEDLRIEHNLTLSLRLNPIALDAPLCSGNLTPALSLSGTVQGQYTLAQTESIEASLLPASGPQIIIEGADPEEYSQTPVSLSVTTDYPDANPVYNAWNDLSATLTFYPREVSDLRCGGMYWYLATKDGVSTQHMMMPRLTYTHSPAATLSIGDTSLEVLPTHIAAVGAHDGTSLEPTLFSLPCTDECPDHALSPSDICVHSHVEPNWSSLVGQVWLGPAHAMGVKMSEIYLFRSAGQNIRTEGLVKVESPTEAPRRAAPTYTHTALSSEGLELLAFPSESVTGIDEASQGILYQLLPGAIALYSDSTQIISMQGVILAKGTGLHTLPAGIYLIADSHATVKVTVR